MKNITKKILLLFFLIFYLFGLQLLFAQNSVLILSSSKIAAFKQCIDSIQNALPGINTIHLYVKEVPNLEAEIKKNNPTLIITIGTAATKAAQKHAANIPVVFSFIMNPVKSGYLKNGNTTKTNICGVTMNIPIEDQFKMIIRLLPKTSKIGIIYSDKNSAIVNKAGNVANALGLTLISKKINDKSEINKALNDLTGEIDILWSVPDATVFAAGRSILLHTVKNKIPFMSFSHQYVKAGALFSLYCDFDDMGKQAAEIALEIIETGKNPTDIPMEYPRKQLLAINLKVAELLKINIPSELKKEATLKF